MSRIIRPRRVRNWPLRFWTRAQGSCVGNDLECRKCGGSGQASRSICSRCLGSGLLVPRRTPADLEEVQAAEVAWACVSDEDLAWPLPWVWEVPLLFVRGAGDLYLSNDDVLAYMDCGRLCLALFRLTEGSKGHLEAAFREAAPEPEVPEFVVPRSCL